MREIQKQHPEALAILHKAVECLDIAYRMNPKQAATCSITSAAISSSNAPSCTSS